MISYYTARKMNVHHFDNAEVFLSELRGQSSSQVPYDLLLTDLMMPEMNGIELTQKVKALYPDMPVIVMTGNSSVDTAIEAIEAGASDYIVKPPHFPHLNIVLQRTLHFSQIERENARLRKSLEASQGRAAGIVAKSPLVIKAIELAKCVAPSDATVLITGESGTGKEVFAQLIHRSSQRATKPFIAINCSAIPENLLESELFGHVKGAFTGAESGRIGLFEEADGGTLFLDEIGDMSQHLQAKLLRVLQERKIKRIGENVFREINVRIIAATLKNLSVEVKAKRFREDLFYRLNVIPLRLPNLRERRDDILPLAKHFLERFSLRYDKKTHSFTREAAEWLLSHRWPGNVRELENSIERATVLAQGELVQLNDLCFDSDLEETSRVVDTPEATPSLELDPETRPADTAPNDTEELLRALNAPGPAPTSNTLTNITAEPATLAEFELRYIREVLNRCDGVKERAARILGIDRKTLYRKMQSTTEIPNTL